MTEIRLAPDGRTIAVFVPMTWRRRGGRKVIVAPPGAEDWAPPPKIDDVLVKALARAWRWQRMLDEGQFASVRELAEAERVSHSYVSRILRLNMLAPDIVERILDGREGPQLAQLMQPFPVAWSGSGCSSADDGQPLPAPAVRPWNQMTLDKCEEACCPRLARQYGLATAIGRWRLHVRH